MYIGLDVHKKRTYMKAVDEEGNIIREEKFLTTIDELDKFVETIEEGDQVALEASTSGMFVYEQLERHKVNVKVAHPQQVRAIASAKVKTDQIDAEVLAQLLRMNYLPEAYVPPQNMRELRVLVRHRVSLVRLRVQVKNKIHALLTAEGISSPYSDLFGVGGMEFLKQTRLNPSRKHAMNQLTQLIENINQMVDETTELLEDKVATMPEVMWLTSLRGIGTYCALLILAEVGDIHRFPTPKPLVSYVGLHPRVCQSGDTTRYGHISRQSNGLLRWALIQAAHKAIQKPGRFQQVYLKLAARKPKQVAITATARHMLESVYWVLTKQEPYKDHTRQTSSETFMGSMRAVKMMGAA